MRPDTKDVLERLLRDADPDTAERAGRLVTFARLLVDDARAPRASSTAVNLERARAELDRLVAREVRAAVADLLVHCDRAHWGSEGFAALAPPGRDYARAWRELESHASGHPVGKALPQLPPPGEPALDVARRLLEFAEAGPGLDGWEEWWRARLEWAARGAARAEPSLRTAAEQALAASGSFALACESVVAVAQCLLDRGAVRRAQEWLDAHLRFQSVDPRAARLAAWTHALLDEHARARELSEGAPAPRDPLPRPLAELVERRPEWRRWFRGAPPLEGGCAVPARIAERTDAGAAVFGVLARGAAGEARAVHLDVAPSLSERTAAWLADRDDCCRTPGEPEHELATSARAVYRHREGDAPLRGALSTAARAVALTPIADGEGEVAGWVRVECEHHLLPSAARLERTAAEWRARVLGGEPPPADPVPPPAPSPADPRAALVRAWLARWGAKTNSRRWWVFDAAAEGPVLRGDGGGALADWRRAAGGGGALRRALAARGAVAFGEPAPKLAQHREAGSGLVAPIELEGRVVALLAVESSRRGDFRGAERRRWVEAAAGLGPAYRAAQFRAWHARRFGHDLSVELEGLCDAPLRELVATARSSLPVLVWGPPGAGKETLCRWLHFEAGRRGWAVVPCGVGGGRAVERQLFGRGARRGLADRRGVASIVLTHVERLTEATQVRVADRLGAACRPRGSDAVDSEPRWMATCLGAPEEAVERGDLRPDLASRLERLRLGVPPLSEHRARIPPLVDAFLARFAVCQGRPAPHLTDDAVAFLWRQEWPGNVRQLEGFGCKLAALHAGREVGSEELADLAARLRLPTLRRLPSRRPNARDVRAALTWTARKSGALNKRRAAMYLGWDPDTLVARMRDLEIDDAAPDGESA